MKSLDYDGVNLLAKFYVPQRDFAYVLHIIKMCEGHVFDAKKKRWVILPTQANIDHLIKYEFTPSAAVRAIWENRPVYTKREYPQADIDASLLDPRIFPYQMQGIRWLEAMKGTGIIGLPVGLGKSNIAASYARLHEEDRPALIVCPACVKINWSREVVMWAKENSILILFGKTPERINPNYKWVIINYDILSSWVGSLMERKFKYLVGDESTFVNNPKAARSKAFIRLARTIKKKVLLSATPIRNRPAEFYTALNLVDRKTFSNRHAYNERYCDPKYDGFSWTYKGITNEEELFDKVSQVMFRRKKEDVCDDLPEKRKIIVPFALDTASQKQYDKADKAFSQWMEKTKEKVGPEGQAHIATLRQLAYIGKRDGVIEWITTFLESGEKLAVFLWHTHAIDDIHEAFKKESVVVDGRTNSTQKQANIDSFQNDPKTRLFIGQCQAAGIGITLTAASSLAIIEFPQTPGDIEQIMGRIDRIGQQSPIISMYFLVGAGTVDEDTALLLDEKSKMLNKTLDGESGEDIFGMNIVTMLMSLYAKKGAT